LFLENWARLTKDPWVLSTVKGYQIPLECWPDKHWSMIIVREEHRSILQEEVDKLREKEAVHSVQQSEAHIVSPIFIIPKSGGGWRLIIHIVQPHFKIEGLYMLPSIISHGWFLVKLDLKDAYLTIPIVLESPNLPSWPTTPPDAIPLPPVRALHRTICLFKDNKACNSVSVPVRHQSNYLYRRLATGSSHQGAVIGGPGFELPCGCSSVWDS